MRSTGGFCDRCGDELQIDGNGNANYERWSGGAIQEKKTAKITPQQIEDLVGAITRPNVLSQEQKEAGPFGPFTVHCSDCPTVDLKITLSGKYNHISNSYDPPCELDEVTAPKTLCKLEYKIETIVNSDQWVILPLPTP